MFFPSTNECVERFRIMPAGLTFNQYNVKVQSVKSLSHFPNTGNFLYIIVYFCRIQITQSEPISYTQALMQMNLQMNSWDTIMPMAQLWIIKHIIILNWFKRSFFKALYKSVEQQDELLSTHLHRAMGCRELLQKIQSLF